LFLNADVYRAHEEDKAAVLARAAANWPDMQHVSYGIRLIDSAREGIPVANLMV